MTLGQNAIQADHFRTTADFCAPRVRPDSIYALLHREYFSLFPDELFGDLFTDVGRRSIPPLIVAVVMVLQRLECCSDREAVERFTYDARWKYAAGGLPFDYPGFAHTVLVDMRARLARSERSNRIFEFTLEVTRAAGLVGVRWVLDSPPLYDPVATMDTATLVRSAIRGLLGVAGEREAALRALLRRDDDYRSAGKPVCDIEDRAAREALVDALACDGHALLTALDGARLPPLLTEAATLLATVLGQDLDEGSDLTFWIARPVAPDRVIGTADPEARHGHKSAAHGFDGYKAPLALDPDAEIISATAVSAGNAGDAAAAPELLAAELAAAPDCDTPTGEPSAPGDAPDRDPLTVYGAGALLETLEVAGATVPCKVQPPVAPGGRFTKADFAIDLVTRTVTCPAGAIAPLRSGGREAIAAFDRVCAGCPLLTRCTTSTEGRRITVGPHEEQLARARVAQRDPAWVADYRAARPKAERKIGHLMRRRRGGRRARVRSRVRVGADFALLAAAVNLARLAVLGLVRSGGTWAVRAT